ncbi:MAG: hypothetical protein ACOCT7_02235 [Candidatus Saliniplasma sp.]
MSRKHDLDRFYELLNRLETKVNDKRKLKDCSGRMEWPDRGVYFFFANDEWREEGSSLRITRIGTHALTDGSSNTLWNRLIAHRGYNRGSFPNGGNQRGSIFRRIVGEAIINKKGLEEEFPHWSQGSTASREIREHEYRLEKRVSSYIRKLPFLWIKIDDKAGPNSDRGYIERNSIALLSNHQKDTIDERSKDWLGYHSPKDKIRQSGLWNSNHVDERYDPAFLDVLKKYIEEWSP